MMTKQDKLDNGKMESLVASLRSLATSHPELAKQIRTEADYFETNTERMRYLKFRRQKLFVGSGVIEPGAKRSLGLGSNNRACSGPCAEPTPSLPSVAADSAVGSRITGKAADVDLTYMSRTGQSLHGSALTPLYRSFYSAFTANRLRHFMTTRKT